jgi:hypothetical protein
MARVILTEKEDKEQITRILELDCQILGVPRMMEELSKD